MLQNVQLIILSELNGLHLSIQSLVAKSHNILWCSFNINPDQIWMILHLSDHNFPLESLAKWKLHNLWRKLIPINHFLLHIFLVIHEELYHADFNC